MDLKNLELTDKNGISRYHCDNICGTASEFGISSDCSEKKITVSNMSSNYLRVDNVIDNCIDSTVDDPHEIQEVPRKICCWKQYLIIVPKNIQNRTVNGNYHRLNQNF